MWNRIRNILAAVGAALLALLTGVAIGRRARRPLGREVDRQLERTKGAAARAGDVASEERGKAEDRQKRARELDERLRRFPGGPLPILLLVVLLAAFAPVAMAESPAAATAPSAELPGDYEALAQMYLDAVQIAAEYRELYRQAEESNTRLLTELEALRAEVQRLTQVVDRQQALIERQQQSILGLLRPRIGAAAGVAMTGLGGGGGGLGVIPWVGVSLGF